MQKFNYKKYITKTNGAILYLAVMFALCLTRDNYLAAMLVFCCTLVFWRNAKLSEYIDQQKEFVELQSSYITMLKQALTKIGYSIENYIDDRKIH